MADQNQNQIKSKARTTTAKRSDPQVGAALRSVYQKAIEEAVPDEMLALLSKLD